MVVIYWLAMGAVILATVSGSFGFAFRSRPRRAQLLSCLSLCLASLLGLAVAAWLLLGAEPRTYIGSWSVPGGAFSLRFDALAALFLIPILFIPAMGAIYGLGYWPQERLGPKAVRLQLAFGLVTGAMALLVLAANAILFLVAWEVMAIAGFLLVLTEHEKTESQRAAFIYLATAHVGTFALFAFFCLAARETGSFDFESWRGLSTAGSRGGWYFALLLTGFGVKAGLIPVHFWLPPAHAAAPSHVSAIMSGVLLKTGVYGLLRITGLMGTPPASWGMLLVAVGAVSGVLGVAFALGQHNLKRLLAWHSVENLGIITMGIGLAFLGRSRGDPALTLLGFSGAVLHVVNHALFKGLLFLGAGSLQHACGAIELDRLGGLARRMPFTAPLFLVGAVAISGLPPLNGFVSEWLVGLGALRVLQLPPGDLVAFAVLTLPTLALIGGLASACFVKVQGVAFLGTARSEAAESAHESPRSMLVPMAALAVACAVIGLLPRLWVTPLSRAAEVWIGSSGGTPSSALQLAATAATKVGLAATVLILLTGVAVWARLRLARRRAEASSETWGCGYAAPTSRMQYTGSSFAEMLVSWFSWALVPHVKLSPPQGAFPRSARFHVEVADTLFERGLEPAIRAIDRLAAFLKPLILGSRVCFHTTLVLATLVFFLAWRFVFR